MLLILPKISLVILAAVSLKNMSLESTKILNLFEHELFLSYIFSVFYLDRLKKKIILTKWC